MSAVIDAVVMAITQPAVPGTRHPSAPGQPQGTSYRGGFGHQAVAGTIQIHRVVEKAPRAIVATEYDDTNGQHWLYFYGVTQSDDGTWRVEGGAGGSGRGPNRTKPWVNFGGWGWPRFLALAGTVHGEGVHIVRARDGAGTTVMDVVEDGLALLLSNDPVEMPCRIELLDASGATLAEQVWPPSLASQSSC